MTKKIKDMTPDELRAYKRERYAARQAKKGRVATSYHALSKKLKDMTPEEQREYRRDVQRRYYHNRLKRAETFEDRKGKLIESYLLPSELIERIINAAHAVRVGKSIFVTKEMMRAVKCLERLHNDGQPFPPAPDKWRKNRDF